MVVLFVVLLSSYIKVSFNEDADYWKDVLLALVTIVGAVITASLSVYMIIVERLAANRPYAYASIFRNMDYECKNSKRPLFARFIVETDNYKKIKGYTGHDLTFLRVRNDSVHTMVNTEIKIRYDDVSPVETIVVNHTGGFTEYFIILDQDKDRISVEVNYTTVSQEIVKYTFDCDSIMKAASTKHSHEGEYFLFGQKIRKGKRVGASFSTFRQSCDMTKESFTFVNQTL
jgi:hypothetical protein